MASITSDFVSTVPDAFVQQYSATVFHLAQQMGSRLRGAVRNETQKGSLSFWDRIGLMTAQPKLGRHTDTPQYETPNSRRAVALTDYEFASLVDSQDKLRLLLDPTSEYMKAFTFAFGRAIDDVIIAAATGTAYTGQNGATAQTIGNAQQIVNVSGGSATNLTVDGLRAAKRKFDAAEVDPSEKRYIAVNASQIANLLSQTQVTSHDYASIRALERGEINEFMGFTFIHSERTLNLSTSTPYDPANGVVGSTLGAADSSGPAGATFSNDANGFRQVICWSQHGLLLSIGEDFVGRVGERPDKGYSMQAYAKMSIGAVRMEEVKVVSILCNEAATN